MTTERANAAVAGAWLGEGRRVVSALLVEVEHSAPLPPGASMLIDGDGRVEGSITGGCVESAVAQEAEEVLAGGAPRLLSYGITGDLAGPPGLTCGGTVQIFVHELAGAAAETERAALAAAADGRPVAIATLLDGDDAGAKLALVDGETVGSLGSTALLNASVARDLRGLLDQGVTTLRRYGSGGEVLGAELRVHVRSFAPPPLMVVFGAIDFSAALARIASEIGYKVTICDPRQSFVGSARFEAVAEVVVGWPQHALAGRSLGPRDAVLVFTHDPKFDEPALIEALETGAGYVGALGSRKTTADRERRLRESDVDAGSIARIHAPCGLDIGSSTPEEVAISVLAEIIAQRSDRAGEPLREAKGTIQARRT